MTENTDFNQKRFFFVGNHPCLDFVNTFAADKGTHVELLESFADLVAWLVQAGMMDSATAAGVIRRLGRKAEGRRALDQALGFRRILTEAVERLASRRNVTENTLDAVNVVLRHLISYPELVRNRAKLEIRHWAEFTAPIHLVVPVAVSAADLFSRCDPSLIRRCANPDCVLFFYDTTKNHKRRWCSMSLCGNRMKVAAHYQRLRNRREAEHAES